MLYLVISGAPAPEGLPALVTLLQACGWQVVVFSTPFGTRFADVAELERLTGQPVRSEYRMPGTGSRTPPADAVLACPLTFNSVNKFAHGHADNFAVGLLCEMAGYGVPVIVVPHCKPQLARTPRSPPAWRRCAAWASGCCSTRMRRMTQAAAVVRGRGRAAGGGRPGGAGGVDEHDGRGADRAGAAAARPVAGCPCRAGRPVRVLAVAGGAGQARRGQSRGADPDGGCAAGRGGGADRAGRRRGEEGHRVYQPAAQIEHAMTRYDAAGASIGGRAPEGTWQRGAPGRDGAWTAYSELSGDPLRRHWPRPARADQ